MSHEKQIDFIYGSQYSRPSNRAIAASKRFAREQGLIPRGCHIRVDQAYGGWAIFAEWFGSERTARKYFN